MASRHCGPHRPSKAEANRLHSEDIQRSSLLRSESMAAGVTGSQCSNSPRPQQLASSLLSRLSLEEVSERGVEVEELDGFGVRWNKCRKGDG